MFVGRGVEVEAGSVECRLADAQKNWDANNGQQSRKSGAGNETQMGCNAEMKPAERNFGRLAERC
jgi:hypothetical protein